MEFYVILWAQVLQLLCNLWNILKRFYTAWVTSLTIFITGARKHL